MEMKVLAVDPAWTPDRWLDWDEVINAHNRGLVHYPIGETCRVLRGGVNAKTGQLTTLEVGSILVLDTRGHMAPYSWVPPVTRRLLVARDRHTCAYCLQKFREKDLTTEHIHPASRGGLLVWTNVVAACAPCNSRKADRRPEEAGMELGFLPYNPNRNEMMIMSNKFILADQMEFLSAKLPKHSRLRH
ncbi:MAG: HNH endonuclease [Agitococcus sp.]|nr:HNH endonuclease [Agitococcus sp.]MDO9178622.1 HNH endonuclease [Agitococcus sp.]